MQGDTEYMVNMWMLGNLHFVNVVPEDHKRGAKYTCVAQNRVMRGIQQGEFNTITPHGGN